MFNMWNDNATGCPTVRAFHLPQKRSSSLRRIRIRIRRILHSTSGWNYSTDIGVWCCWCCWTHCSMTGTWRIANIFPELRCRRTVPTGWSRSVCKWLDRSPQDRIRVSDICAKQYHILYRHASRTKTDGSIKSYIGYRSRM